MIIQSYFYIKCFALLHTVVCKFWREASKNVFKKRKSAKTKSLDVCKLLAKQKDKNIVKPHYR